MTDALQALRYLSAFTLIVWGIAGIVQALSGMETSSPIYFAAAIAAGAGALPETADWCCRLWRGLPTT